MSTEVMLIKELLRLDDVFVGVLESFPDFYYFGEYDILYCLYRDGYEKRTSFDPDSRIIQCNTDRYRNNEGRIRIESGDRLVVYREDGITVDKVVCIDSTCPTNDWIKGATRSEFDSWFKAGKERRAQLIRKRYR